jgi:hypothetical protein
MAAKLLEDEPFEQSDVAAAAGWGLVRVTSVPGGRAAGEPARVAGVAALGLHWAGTAEARALHSSTKLRCSPAEAWGWLLRVWGVFLFCWSGALAAILIVSSFRFEKEGESPDSAASSAREFLFGGGCLALSCAGWSVLAALVTTLGVVAMRGAADPWP